MEPQDERLTSAPAEEATQPRRRAPRRAAVSEAVAEDRGTGERGLGARETDIAGDDRLSQADEDAFQLFLESTLQTVLPDIPKIPGYHVCWLTNTNLRDTIAYRERIGYTAVRRSEVRGWEAPNVNTASTQDDLITVNEMVAYKIPLRLYNRFMEELHHRRPLDEEEKLRASTQRVKQQLEQVGSRVAEEGDGTAEIVQRPTERPVFAP